MFHLVANVKILHFHRARVLFFDGTIGNDCLCSIVTVNGGWSLCLFEFCYYQINGFTKLMELLTLFVLHNYFSHCGGCIVIFDGL